MPSSFSSVTLIASILLMVFCFPVSAATELRSASLNYDDVTKIIHEKNVRSIEQLLPLLSEEFRSHYTLMYESRSQQAASSIAPRVILFGPDARLTCTFNGGSTQFGGDTLECFQFKDAEKLFDFRQIQFPSGDNQLTEVQFSESNKSADGSISCSACHGSDPRPNWDGYSQWPGSYGSEDDEIDDDELTSFKSFVASRPTHPRYKWLIQDAKNSLAPYSNSSALIENRPNLQFSDLIGRMNSRRDGRLIKSRLPSWGSLAYAFKALDCSLSTDQIARAKKVKADFAVLITFEALYGNLNLPANQWTTEVFNDHDRNSTDEFEHQAGFGFLSHGVAIDVLEDYASRAGSPLPAIFQKMRLASTNFQSPNSDTPEMKKLFGKLNSIALVPDQFNGTELKDAQAALCPVATELFTELFEQAFEGDGSTMGARVADDHP